ncbi:hypothetical protein MKW92_015032 [Papaver armeniacum]|nr:hypothetical protein MKW92_015032 [Papaver armeniacum]
MKSLEFGKYCCKYSTKDKTNCLAACLEYPDEFNYMEIEEPVLSRTIDNVRYRLTDARLYDEKKIALITNDSSNKTNQPLKSELNLKTTVTNTTNWSTNSSWKVGVKEKVTVSVPLIVSGELEVSAEYAKSSSWGETETKTIEVGNVVTVTVPPMTRVKGV